VLLASLAASASGLAVAHVIIGEAVPQALQRQICAAVSEGVIMFGFKWPWQRQEMRSAMSGFTAELAQLARFAVESTSRFVAAGESDQGVGCGMGPDFGV
jgi:hypothetical protein